MLFLSGKVISCLYVSHWVVYITGILALIIVRTLRRDIARYNRDEEFVSNALLYFMYLLIFNVISRRNYLCIISKPIFVYRMIYFIYLVIFDVFLVGIIFV